jgi:hypothetical protein
MNNSNVFFVKFVWGLTAARGGSNVLAAPHTGFGPVYHMEFLLVILVLGRISNQDLFSIRMPPIIIDLLLHLLLILSYYLVHVV